MTEDFSMINSLDVGEYSQLFDQILRDLKFIERKVTPKKEIKPEETIQVPIKMSFEAGSEDMKNFLSSIKPDMESRNCSDVNEYFRTLQIESSELNKENENLKHQLQEKDNIIRDFQQGDSVGTNYQKRLKEKDLLIKELEEDVESQKTMARRYKAKLKNLEEETEIEISEKDTEIKKLKKEIRELKKNVGGNKDDEIEELYATMNVQKEDFEKKKKKLIDNHSSLDSENKSLKKEIEELKKTLTSSQNIIEENKKKIEELESEIDKITKEKAEVEKILETKKSAMEKMKGKIQTSTGESADINKLEKKIHAQKCELDQYEVKIKEYRENYEKAANDADKYKADTDKLRKELQDLKKLMSADGTNPVASVAPLISPRNAGQTRDNIPEWWKKHQKKNLTTVGESGSQQRTETPQKRNAEDLQDCPLCFQLFPRNEIEFHFEQCSENNS